MKELAKFVGVIILSPFLWPIAVWELMSQMFRDISNFADGSPTQKGISGENNANNIIQVYCKKRQFLNFRDLLIPNKFTQTSQIDNIIITNHAIAVIEIKNLRGRKIDVYEYDEWNQHFDRTCYELRNPLKQNWGHIQALKAILGDEIPYFNVVLLVKKVNLNSFNISQGFSKVGYVEDLEEIINNLDNKVINRKTINKEEILSQIKANNITDQTVRSIHNKRHVG